MHESTEQEAKHMVDRLLDLSYELECCEEATRRATLRATLKEHEDRVVALVARALLPTGGPDER